jgi:hypothetical protein
MDWNFMEMKECYHLKSFLIEMRHLESVIHSRNHDWQSNGIYFWHRESFQKWMEIVLAQAPVMNTRYYITYEKDPALYMYQLLDDYKDNHLHIL